MMFLFLLVEDIVGIGVVFVYFIMLRFVLISLFASVSVELGCLCVFWLGGA